MMGNKSLFWTQSVKDVSIPLYYVSLSCLNSRNFALRIFGNSCLNESMKL